MIVFLSRFFVSLSPIVSLVIAGTSLYAQVTAADYKRALGLRDEYSSMVKDVPEKPSWIGKTDRFWYRKSVDGGGYAFVLVDAAEGTRTAAFDQARLAHGITAAGGQAYEAGKLPFSVIEFSEDEKQVQFAIDSMRWSCGLQDYVCLTKGKVEDYDDQLRREGDEADAEQETPPRPRINSIERSVISPDGKWEALIENFNVVLRQKSSAPEEKSKADESSPMVIPLSRDGSSGAYYLFSSIVWSPDSRHVSAYRVRPGYKRLVHYTKSSPTDQLQPEYYSLEYAKPGDVLDLQQPVLFDVATRRDIQIDASLFPNPYELSSMAWRKDSRAFTFEYNQRGHQVYRVIEVNAETGAARSLINEQSKTFIDYRLAVPEQYDTGRQYRYDVADGREMIWMSERDGWAHLYLYDGATGALKNQITRGQWVVRGVDWVDETKRQIWFEASGMDAKIDPYFVSAWRINFDGTGLTKISGDDTNHHYGYSPDHKYYVDTWSRLDRPPVMELRRAADQSLVMPLEHGDASKLMAAGWQAPEVFKAKGRDGVTDIWGIVYRPAHFDPGRKYPVIEEIYAGPQGSFVPKDWGVHYEPLTQLGFVVVQIDGMGTNNRSKAFHDVAWRNLKDAGFADRILWHKAVAAKYPWYDITRVGVFGTSAGGQSAMGALLFHPDFYKAAVANSGCHDNRMDKIWWNEQWMGWPVGPQYADSSNVDNAWRLQGKLMLVVGEMDTNVDPSSTFQVVNALMKADKQYDLLVVPGGGHGSGGDYGRIKMYDFFVRNLLGEKTPDWNAIPGGEMAKQTPARGHTGT